jgi:hypothetical protein
MKILLTLISLFLFLACAPKNEAVSTGNKFVSLYYQQMNQEEAIKISDMMARDKLQKEFELVHESRIKNPQLPENRSKVTYKLEESKIEKDMGFLTYILTIQPTGSAPFDKTALITLQNENNVWKVINYEEVSSAEK